MQDLSKVIKDRIKNYDNIIRETETGYVIEVGDGIARIHGLDACMAGELIELDGGVMSMALNLEEDNVSVVILGEDVSALLEEEDYTRQKKHENKKMSGPVMVYWLIATAIYLAWSFTTNDWDRTWIIWPVVGVLFPAFYAIVNGIRKKS